MKRVCMVKVLGLFSSVMLFSAASMAADVLDTDNHDLSVSPIVETLSAGDTKTYAGVLYGTGGVTNNSAKGGVLVLSGDNAFSGGTVVLGGTVRGTHANAFGTGAIEASPASATTTRSIEFAASGATFTNAIAARSNSGFASPLLAFSQPGTYNGSLNAGGHELYVGCDAAASGSTVKGSIAGATQFGFAISGIDTVLNVESVFSCGRFHLGTGSYQGTVNIKSAGNSASYFRMGLESVRLDADGAFSSVPYLDTGSSYPQTSDCGNVDLNGHDLSVSYITTYSANTLSSWVGWAFKSDGHATLRMTGMSGVSSATTSFALRGNLDLEFGTSVAYTQTFSDRYHSISGRVDVMSGTMILSGDAKMANLGALNVASGAAFTADVTTAGAFASLTNLTVDGTMSFGSSAASPFSDDNTLEIVLGDEASLSLPSGTILHVKSLTIGGVPYEGTIPDGECPQISGATVVVDAQASADSWTGLGDGMMSSAGNWSSGKAPNLAAGLFTATFAESGSSAVLDAPAALAGLVFNENAKPFSVLKSSLAPSAALAVGDGGVSFAPGAAVAIEPPLVALSLDVASAASVALTGGATVDGSMILTNGQMLLSGTVSASGGADTGLPDWLGDDDMSVSHPGAVAANNYPAALCISNATICKAVRFAKGEYKGNAGYGWTPFTLPGCPVTNVFNGYVYAVGSTSCYPTFTATAGSVMEFNATFGVYEVIPRFIGGTWIFNGTTYINRYPAVLAGIAGTTTRLVFGGTLTSGTSASRMRDSLYPQDSGVTFEFTASRAMDGRGYLGLGPYENCEIDFNATTQRVLQVTAAFAAGGPSADSRMTGGYPAMLEVLECGTNKTHAIDGGLGFMMSGAGTLLFEGAAGGAAYASCGDLVVSNGTMEFAAGASWPNGTNITVCANGRLKAASRRTFSADHAVLTIAGDGVVEIPSGVLLRVACIRYDDGTEVRTLTGGNYTTLNPGLLAGHIAGGGGIAVGPSGMMLQFR